MDDLITKGFAGKVKPSQSDNEGHVGYIPHHGVYHPQKPEKIRVVFDCSSRYKGESLNYYLLQGSDLTNFVGAEGEFSKAMSELDFDRIRQYLLEQNCDFVQFKMNVPSASHMGDVWEKQIRSVRNILSTLLCQLGTQLADESLRTLMSEATSIVNSRPLTLENLNDLLSVEPLTPHHLLTMKSAVFLPPPGNFMKNDVHSRKRWRRVQFLVNEFWSRWRIFSLDKNGSLRSEIYLLVTL
ncbi:unnamed protein product [Mytilus coruscus]|uniref:DUF5641 domain-containing protein n=1 Tax=Mytilus coruscus TaxID=42192 RepID=A0A6J8ECQ1_MYTCO|nr:unnamed protein product [Mytilus coruscus]